MITGLGLFSQGVVSDTLILSFTAAFLPLIQNHALCLSRQFSLLQSGTAFVFYDIVIFKDSRPVVL